MLWAVIRNEDERESKTWHILYTGQMWRVAGEIGHADLQSQLRETAGFHIHTQTNHSGDYEKLLDFTSRHKLKLIINQLFDTLH